MLILGGMVFFGLLTLFTGGVSLFLFALRDRHPLALLGALLTGEPLVLTPVWFFWIGQMPQLGVPPHHLVRNNVLSMLPSLLVLCGMSIVGLSLGVVSRDMWREVSVLIGGAALRWGNTLVLTLAVKIYANVHPWLVIAYITLACGAFFPAVYASMALYICYGADEPS